MNSVNAFLYELVYGQPKTFYTLWFAVSWLGCCYDFLGRFNKRRLYWELFDDIRNIAYVKSPGIWNGACVCCRTRQSLRLQTTPRLFVYDHYQSNDFLELPVRGSNLLQLVEHVVADPNLRATPSFYVKDILSFPHLSGGATVREYLCERYSIVSTLIWRSHQLLNIYANDILLSLHVSGEATSL